MCVLNHAIVKLNTAPVQQRAKLIQFMLRSVYEHASAHIFPTHSVLSVLLIFTNLLGENWYLILIYIFPDTNEVDCSFNFYFEIITDPQEVAKK